MIFNVSWASAFSLFQSRYALRPGKMFSTCDARLLNCRQNLALLVECEAIPACSIVIVFVLRPYGAPDGRFFPFMRLGACVEPALASLTLGALVFARAETEVRFGWGFGAVNERRLEGPRMAYRNAVHCHLNDQRPILIRAHLRPFPRVYQIVGVLAVARSPTAARSAPAGARSLCMTGGFANKLGKVLAVFCFSKLKCRLPRSSMQRKMSRIS